MSDQEIKETLKLVLLKIEQLSYKISLLENKLTPNETTESHVVMADSPVGDVKQQIESMRAEFMKKHQQQMQELKQRTSSINTDLMKEGGNVLVKPPSDFGE